MFIYYVITHPSRCEGERQQQTNVRLNCSQRELFKNVASSRHVFPPKCSQPFSLWLASHTLRTWEGGASARRHKLSSEEQEVQIFCTSSPKAHKEGGKKMKRNKKLIQRIFFFFLLLERSICFNIQINAVDGFVLTLASGALKKKKKESIILRERNYTLHD